MQIKIFTLSLFPTEEELEELNHFLRSCKIIECKKELTQKNSEPFWTFAITYIPNVVQSHQILNQAKGKKIDYKDVLSEDEFSRFVTLRQLRKEIASEEAIPAYAVFTDAELAEIAKLDDVTETNLQKIPGIGAKRVEKYGVRFCKSPENEESGLFD